MSVEDGRGRQRTLVSLRQHNERRSCWVLFVCPSFSLSPGLSVCPSRISGIKDSYVGPQRQTSIVLIVATHPPSTFLRAVEVKDPERYSTRVWRYAPGNQAGIADESFGRKVGTARGGSLCRRNYDIRVMLNGIPFKVESVGAPRRLCAGATMCCGLLSRNERADSPIPRS